MTDCPSEREAPATPAPGSLRAPRALVGAVCLLVLGVYAWNVRSGVLELGNATAQASYYNLLVEGFRAGQLNLQRAVPPGLARLPDYYDPAAGSWLLDLSYYQGKLYLYFGLTPALVLFWPYAAATGHHLLHRDAALIFFSAGFLAGVSLLWALWRRYFAQVSAGVMAAGALALGLANLTPAILVRSDVFEVAIGCGYALMMVTLLLVWRALHAARGRLGWLAAASLAYGLALGARPSLLFGAVILLVPVFQGGRQNHKWTQMDTDRVRRRNPIAGLLTSVSGKLLLAATVPITCIGLGLLLYNYLRFDDPLEFGQRYQLPAGPRQQFSLDYLWFNFRVCFLAPARWSLEFPFVHDIRAPALPAGHGRFEHPFGVLTNIPLAWLALAAPLAWRKRPAAARSAVRGFALAAGLLFASSALILCLHDSMVLRYEVEFAGPLILLAVIGIFGLERALAGRPAWRLGVRCGWALALAGSVAFNLFLMVGLSSEYHLSRGAVAFRHGQFAEAIRQFEQALKLQPGNAEARNSLGAVLCQQGDLSASIGHLEAALRLKPDMAEAHNNLGLALSRAGRIPEAVSHLEQALRLKPDFAGAHHHLAEVRFNQGRVAEAISHLEQALRSNPGDVLARENLVVALIQSGEDLADQGQLAGAIDWYQRAVQFNPDNALARERLGTALNRWGRNAEAAAHYRKAVDLDPTLVTALNNLAWLLATATNAAVRDVAEAVRLAQRACELTTNQVAGCLDTLAVAYAGAGRFGEAAQAAGQGAARARAAGDQELAAQIERRLQSYQARRPDPTASPP